MNLRRAIFVALAFLIPVSWTIARAGDEEKKDEKKEKKAKKGKKADGDKMKDDKMKDEKKM